MKKELTNKMKEKIVEYQINVIKEKEGNNPVSQDFLKEYLMEGINRFSLEGKLFDEELDLKLLRKIENSSGSMVLVRLINSARHYFKIDCPNNPTDKQLLELYNAAEKELIKNEKYFSIKNYGQGTHNLLKFYLKEKKLL